MAIPGQGNQFDPGQQLDPYWPPNAPVPQSPYFPPGSFDPIPPPQQFFPDGGPIPDQYDPQWEGGPPQFLPPYSPDEPSPFQLIPGGPTLPGEEERDPYIAGLPYQQGGDMPNQPMIPAPAGASPGMPGVGAPPYGPPQTGGAAPTFPGTGYVPFVSPPMPPMMNPPWMNQGGMYPPLLGDIGNMMMPMPQNAGPYGAYNPNLPIGPGNMSPGAPGTPYPYGPPQAGGAFPTTPGMPLPPARSGPFAPSDIGTMGIPGIGPQWNEPIYHHGGIPGLPPFTGEKYGGPPIR